MDVKTFWTQNPDQDSDYFLRFLWKKTAADLLLQPHKKIPPGVLKKINAWKKRRAAGYPVQYLTGRAWFADQEFIVTPATLIPRPESELFLTVAKNLPTAPRTIIDVGTGSGCLAISLKKIFPQATVSAGDISRAALRVARTNARRNHAAIKFWHSDLLTKIPWPTTTPLLLVSNLPYLPTTQKKSLSPTVKFEPTAALFGGQDGLDFYRRLCQQLKKRRRPQQKIFWLAEIEPQQQKKFAHLGTRIFPTAHWQFYRDAHGDIRLVAGTW